MSQLLAVQVLRALAALAVVIHHAQFDAATIAAKLGQSWTPSDLLPWLAGVDVFFVISGFIMVHSSASLFGRQGGTRVFLVRRVARIVPLYWTVTTLFLIVAALAPQTLNSAAPRAAEIVASYLFFPFVRAEGEVQPIYSLGWTLNYEMFFYVLFAAALPLPKVMAVTAVAAGLAAGSLAGHAFAPLPEPLAFWTNPLVLEFVFGMGLALARSRGVAWPFAARLALAAVALLLLHADLTRADGAWVLPRFLAYGVPAAMLVAAATLAPEPTRPPRFERALAALGDASYALYLFHPFVIRSLREFVLRAGLAKIGPWAFVGLAVTLALVASLFIHRLFEQPVTRSLRRRFGA